jgi:hypothetical protein
MYNKIKIFYIIRLAQQDGAATTRQPVAQKTADKKCDTRRKYHNISSSESDIVSLLILMKEEEDGGGHGSACVLKDAKSRETTHYCFLRGAEAGSSSSSRATRFLVVPR